MLLENLKDEMRQILPGEKWKVPGDLPGRDKNDEESENEQAECICLTKGPALSSIHRREACSHKVLSFSL